MSFEQSRNGSRGAVKRLTRLVTAFVLLTCVLLSPVAEAAGSRYLVQNGGYRGAIEWYNGTTANISRYQRFTVYAKEGESILVAGSVFNGKNGDIVYYKPDDIHTPHTADVIENGAGYIASPAKEQAGPYFTYSEDGAIVGSCGDENGYTPIEIPVGAGETGEWTFEFHSQTDTAQNNGSNNNAFKTMADAQWSGTQQGLVYAWDISVVQNPHTDHPSFKTGRVFTDYLTLNVCFNAKGADILKSQVYVLTNDGYIYRTDFNGIDPWGFVFFANNRGLIVKNGNSTASLYASAIDTQKDNTLRYLKYIFPNGNTAPVTFHMPTEADTELDQTFKIFFEMPADDLPATIRATPYAPGQVEDFRFEGDRDGHGYVGNGGYFYFKVTRASSFQIKMDFSHYWNGTEYVDGGILYLSNACVDGINRIYWDGRDANGNLVPAGVYGSADGNSGISVTIDLKAGEYHFPLLDVENNFDGIKIRLMNTPLDSHNNEISLTEAERCGVHFNNTNIFDTYALSQYTEAQLSGKYTVSAMEEAFDTSVYGAAAFAKTRYEYASATYPNSTSGTKISQGDEAAVDLWTFYKGDSSKCSTTLERFELEDIPAGQSNGIIDGFVFYDSNKNASFSLSERDYELQRVTVELWSTGTEPEKLAVTQTDLYGQFVFTEYKDASGNSVKLPYGTYTVKVLKPISNAQCTTGNASQQVTLGVESANTRIRVSAQPVGFYYATLTKPVVIYKTWSIDKSFDPNQPDSVMVRLTGWSGENGTGTKYFEEDAAVTLANGWKTTFQNLPQYAPDGVTELKYQVTELMQDAYGNPVTGYTTSVSAPRETATAVEYAVNNVADCSITVHKVDSVLMDKPVAGATFQLYDNADPEHPVLLATQQTNADGVASFTGLQPGTFYYVESLSPAAYTLDSTRKDVVLSATNTGYAPEFLVTNTPITKDFTLTKTLVSASAEDETFYFEINGPDGRFYATVTVPAGDLSASVTCKDMLIGTYSVRELPTNWRYTALRAVSATYAYDGTNPPIPLSSGALIMNVKQTGTYAFCFTNRKSNNSWTSDSDRVENTMAPLS